jgi:cell wall-associated NlpC family hydrolase
MKITARSLSLSFAAATAVVLGLAALPACTTGDDSEDLVGANEDLGSTTEGVTGTIEAGSTLKSTTSVNLRKGPGTSYDILHVVPTGSTVTVVQAAPENGFYKIKHDGTEGWSSGKYYTTLSGPGGDLSAGRQEAINRGKSVKGFSYYWGHGSWLADGPSSTTKGSCAGSCPSCSHSGKYGADCSGFVGKAWKVQGATGELTTDQHPYGTIHFVNDTSQWKTVSRSNALPADALVYNSGGAGHILLFSGGDAWGSMYSYECKGCSAGCVYNLRTASSSYKAIRRTGF